MVLLQLKVPLGTIRKENGISSLLWVYITSLYDLMNIYVAVENDRNIFLPLPSIE